VPARSGPGRVGALARGAGAARAAASTLHLVRLRSSAKNRIFGLLTQWGLRLSLARLRQPDGLELLAARGVHGAWRRSVGEALAVIDLLDERIAPLDAELSPLARADGRVELLDTIPGIGTLLGLTIATEIGQVARFASPRKLIGYAGLAPKVHQSGDSSRSGELSKAGSRVLRWAAVEAAQGAWRETTPGTASTATSSAATPASRIRPRPSSPARSLSPAGTCSAATSPSNHRRPISEPMRAPYSAAMGGDAFAEFERAGWERAAPRYKVCWTDTVLFVEALLDAAAVRAGSGLLDVACGPGFVSEAAAARGARPVGVDVAAAMVERARARCPDLAFVVGDALRLPFPDASFDAVTINFGILHVSQPESALAEAHRVLVPGGRLAFTTWLAQGNAEDEITDAALADHAIAVEVPEGPSYRVFADPDECRQALAGRGFDTDWLRIETVTALWRVPSADFLFEAQLHAGVRPAGAAARAA
jgi:SAM-dependent methyltransferase